MDDYSFQKLQDTYNRYSIIKENSKIKIIDNLSKEEINDENIINMVKFSLIWFKIMGNPIGIKIADYDYKTKYNYAFSEISKCIYDNMMKVINTQLIGNGDIDILELISYFKDNNLKEINELKELFSSEQNIVALNRWFRMAVPDAKFPNKSVETYKQATNKLNDKKTL